MKSKINGGKLKFYSAYVLHALAGKKYNVYMDNKFFINELNTSKKTEDILAHWKFTKENVQSGTLENENLILNDISGNKNYLLLKTFKEHIRNDKQGKLKWAKEPYINGENIKLINFENRKGASMGRYFETIDSAPINSEKFMKGYTIEVVMKMPSDFSPEYHAWMGIITRKGQAADIKKCNGEKEIMTTLSVSSLRELQWTSHPTNLTHNETNWSFSLESSEDWYHIAVINDGINTRLYVNGITDFRNTDEIMLGIDFDEGKGWNIGASESSGELDTLFAGKIYEIRITDHKLPKKEWLEGAFKKNYINSGTNEDVPLLLNRGNYNFVFIPDPQKTVRYQPEIYFEQMNWISKSVHSKNISMTAFVGDMVDQSNEKEEWNVSDKGVSILEKNNVPYVITAGNHDYGAGNPYLAYYNEERFSKEVYFKGISTSGYSSYSIINAGSYKYLFLMVDMKNLQVDLPWAKKVLSNNRNIPTVIISHEILAVSKDGKSAVNTTRGNIIWKELIDNYYQVFLSVGGHHHGSFHRIKKNAAGKEVIQILVDYQSSISGGNGWMRFAEFDELLNKIYFRTYSPWVEKLSECDRKYVDVKFLTSKNDQCELDFNFNKRFDFVTKD